MKRTGGAFSSAELGITEKNPPAGSAMDGSVFRAGAYWAHSAFPFVGRNSPVMSFFSISSSLTLRSSPPAYPVRLPFAPTTRWHGTMMLMGLCPTAPPTACADMCPAFSRFASAPYVVVCWHVVSRGFLVKYRHSHTISCMRRSSFTTELYDPKAFFAHAALLGQGFPHCRKFPTAASRRSMGRVSVPLWLIILSNQLLIVALVVHYTPN